MKNSKAAGVGRRGFPFSMPIPLNLSAIQNRQSANLVEPFWRRIRIKSRGDIVI